MPKSTRWLREFEDALDAQVEGDMQRAADSLLDYIERKGMFKGIANRARCALARAKLARLPAVAELRKPAAERNLSVIASSYIQAARLCYVSGPRKSFFWKRGMCYRAAFFSAAMKTLAFKTLASRTVTEATLKDAERFFFKALKYAEKSNSFIRGNFSITHIWYLTYWHSVVSRRVHLIRYMDLKRGDDLDFRAAQNALRNAVAAAEKLSKDSRKSSIFPNHYYSLVDVKLDELFLNAAKAFREHRWTDCCDELDKWIKECPSQYLHSWRGSQIILRRTGAKLIDSILSRNEEERRTSESELKTLLALQPIGAAGRYFGNEILNLLTKSKVTTLFASTIDHLCNFFPVEAIAESDPHKPKNDPFVSLPSKIHECLQASLLQHNRDAERQRIAIFGAVEAFLGHLCDYYLQLSSSNLPIPEYDLQALFDITINLPVSWVRWDKARNAIKQLRLAIEEINTDNNADAVNRALSDIQESLILLQRFFPLVVNIPRLDIDASTSHQVTAIPDWALPPEGPHGILITLPPSTSSSFRTGKYYLRPGWRRGNRFTYRVSDETRLIQSRFEPRWAFWEKEALVSSSVIIEGVLLEHLRRSIELMKKCKCSSQKPMVGAVIVKDGMVIADAYRGEDGTDRHAEELAIHKCSRQQLQGATMITTLEPCTTHGRSPSVASCAVLLVNSGFGKVIIGIPDPDNRIRGNGDKL